MKFVSSSELDRKVLEEYFENQWDELDNKESLHEFGYLVDYQDSYKAYFALTPVEENAYWLKSLYIKEGVSSSFPLAIMEASITLAKEKGGTYLYVFSHQESLSSLLSLMQFVKQHDPAFAKDEKVGQGEWWIIDVANVPQTNSTK